MKLARQSSGKRPTTSLPREERLRATCSKPAEPISSSREGRYCIAGTDREIGLFEVIQAVATVLSAASRGVVYFARWMTFLSCADTQKSWNRHSEKLACRSQKPAVGEYRGDPLYHASLSPDEHMAPLDCIGFKTLFRGRAKPSPSTVSRRGLLKNLFKCELLHTS
jgi:hypothetical protein